MKPTMGCVVHYVDENGDAWPAMVRASYEHDPDRVDLTALTATQLVRDGVLRDERSGPGTWHWPETSPGAGRPARERRIEEAHATIDELNARRTELLRRQSALGRERGDLAFDRVEADIEHVDAEIRSALDA